MDEATRRARILETLAIQGARRRGTRRTGTPGIPTTHGGTNFRSRLEARWAAFFDLIAWPWVYEPFDADGYIPDFLLMGEYPVLVEIGNCVTARDYIEKATKPDRSAASLDRDIIVLGVSPVAPIVSHSVGPANAAAGWMGEIQVDDSGSSYEWDAGLWGRCFHCGRYGFVHSEMTYSLRPCGHHQGGSFGEDVSSGLLDAAWRRAGNDVQWKPERVGTILGRL